MKRLPVAGKIAKVMLVIYVVTLTVVVGLALTVGPFRESFDLWSQVRVLETKIRESQRDFKKLETERDRLLKALKSLQADWTQGQENIRALRELTKNPESEKKLVEAAQLAEKLGTERAVLISKLNELRQALQACDAAKKTVEPVKP